jgi:hypothetical protein
MITSASPTRYLRSPHCRRPRHRQLEHSGTTHRGEAVSRLVVRVGVQPGLGSAEMIRDGCAYANRKVLMKVVSENLLPTAQAWNFGGQALRQRLQAPDTAMSTCFATSFQIRAPVSVMPRSARTCTAILSAGLGAG